MLFPCTDDFVFNLETGDISIFFFENKRNDFVFFAAVIVEKFESEQINGSVFNFYGGVDFEDFTVIYQFIRLEIDITIHERDFLPIFFYLIFRFQDFI